MLRHTGSYGEVGLAQHGPLINCVLAKDAKPSNGGFIATAHQVVTLLVDTGATITSVDENVCSALGLRPVRFAPITGVSGKAEDYPVYRASIIIDMAAPATPNKTAPYCFSADIVGMPTIASGFHGLIGRDFLQHFTLLYNGPAGRVEIQRTGAEAVGTARRHRVEATKAQLAKRRKNRRR